MGQNGRLCITGQARLRAEDPLVEPDEERVKVACHCHLVQLAGFPVETRIKQHRIEVAEGSPRGDWRDSARDPESAHGRGRRRWRARTATTAKAEPCCRAKAESVPPPNYVTLSGEINESVMPRHVVHLRKPDGHSSATFRLRTGSTHLWRVLRRIAPQNRLHHFSRTNG